MQQKNFTLETNQDILSRSQKCPSFGGSTVHFWTPFPLYQLSSSLPTACLATKCSSFTRYTCNHQPVTASYVVTQTLALSSPTSTTTHLSEAENQAQPSCQLESFADRVFPLVVAGAAFRTAIGTLCPTSIMAQGILVLYSIIGCRTTMLESKQTKLTINICCKGAKGNFKVRFVMLESEQAIRQTNKQTNKMSAVNEFSG